MYQRFILIIFCVFLIGCGNGIESRFPMEKRFWGPKDYNTVYREIRFHGPKGERYPELKNPETALVFKKIIDRQNFEAVLNDDELGIKHRNTLAEDFFEEYKNFATLYYSMDRQDKFVYGIELVEVSKFGLDLQLLYFKLGNDNILQDADDPNESSVRTLLSSNERTIYNNFNNYLDFVNKENAFNENELLKYCEGIDVSYPKLFETFPKGNINITKNKAELMLKKTKKDIVRNSLEGLLKKIADLSV